MRNSVRVESHLDSGNVPVLGARRCALGSWRRNLQAAWLCFAIQGSALLLLLCPLAVAQEPSEGINQGNYNVRQTMELGYRWRDITGNGSVYNTFVNLHEGPRVLEYKLEMRSLNHQGWLFDDFSFANFGYGGDPNNVSRLRAYKNKWYNFSATFRRNRNVWDYNLLANPLNSPTIPANAPSGFSPAVTSSPHTFLVSRRMSDVNLTLLPQSLVRFRLGYSRNVSDGPSFATPRAGTEIMAFQSWKTTLNSYQFGVDFKFLPKTNISFDQFVHTYKGDTTWLVQDFPFQLSNGIPVALGLIYNTAASQPCATPFNATPLGTVNPTCNGFLAYRESGNVRTTYPTEQLSFQSSYFTNLDLSGRVTYSWSDLDVPLHQEFFQGRLSRTNAREFLVSGPVQAKRVAVTTDFGTTWYVTPKFRVVDSFRFHHFRLPGFFDLTQVSLFGPSMLLAPNVFTPGSAPPASCPTITSPGCPVHNSSSPADVISQQYSYFLGENTKFNQFELEYDFTKRIGGRLGYRYRNRDITHRSQTTANLLFFPTLPNRGACAGQPLLPDGSCRATTISAGGDEVEINEHSALVGIWTRPTDELRLTFDLELLSADHSFTRISPRQLQRYKVRGTYKPADWMSFGFTVNILESRNNVPEIRHRQHNRHYSFNTVLSPNEKFALDLGYEYNDIASQTNICFTLTATPLPPGSSPCPIVVPAATTQAISFYNNNVHFGYFNLMWKPVRRLTANLGYAATGTTGSTLILNPNAPPGPLQITYHQPYGGLAVELGKGFTWKANWGYYGYDETSPPDPRTGSRNFRGNILTLAFRHSF